MDAGRILENVIYNHLALAADLFFVKEQREVDFLVCRGLKPVRAVNSTFEAVDEATVSREAEGLDRVSRGYGVPAELVSVYPVKGMPEGIENRLAHRYLADIGEEGT